MQTDIHGYLKHYYVLVKHLPPAFHIMIVINLKKIPKILHHNH